MVRTGAIPIRSSSCLCFEKTVGTPLLSLLPKKLYLSASRGATLRGADHAKLLQQAERVPFGPLFHNLAVHDVVNVSTGKARFLPRRWDALKVPGVLDPNGIVGRHHLALRDQELGGEMDLTEGGEVGGKQVFEGLASSDGCSRHMTCIVGGVEFINDIQVSFVPDLVFPAQHELFIVFGGHGFFLLSLKSQYRFIDPQSCFWHDGVYEMVFLFYRTSVSAFLAKVY